MIAPPPNPNAAAARADMREYNAQYQPDAAHQGETVIAEWHRDDDRTFTADEVKRWFKVAGILHRATLAAAMQAAG